MGNKKTSKKLRGSKKSTLIEHVPFSDPLLKDVEGVIDTLLDCIKENDINTFREVLAAHLISVNKVELAELAGIGRRTIYDLIDPKIEFNPGLKTIMSLFEALKEKK